MSKFEFKQILLNDLIVVELIDIPQGRIKLPDWTRTLRGTVIAAGPGKLLNNGKRASMASSVGDTVSFAATAGMDSDYGTGRKCRIMRDTDIDAVLEVA